MRRRKLFLLFFLVVGAANLYAQHAVPASGGDATGSGGTVSYTVGQVSYKTVDGAGHSVSQGVQQPFEISVVTGIEGASLIQLSCSVYPNPATDHVVLKIENYRSSNLAYQLFGLSGQLIESRPVDGPRATIPMGGLAPSTYFLKVVDKDVAVKTFKIVKK